VLVVGRLEGSGGRVRESRLPASRSRG
jgi:hypothetical protein